MADFSSLIGNKNPIHTRVLEPGITHSYQGRKIEKKKSKIDKRKESLHEDLAYEINPNLPELMRAFKRFENVTGRNRNDMTQEDVNKYVLQVRHDSSTTHQRDLGSNLIHRYKSRGWAEGERAEK